jgi:conjugative transfer pilus assembly protein TraH
MNYYNGGTLYVRYPTRGYSVANLDPPRLNAGCGGIDLYLGSFSFINKDAFVAMLKNIGSNALGLAFQMALENIMPSFNKTLQRMQQTIQEMNALTKNSCTAAKALVGSKSGQINREREFYSSSWGRMQGIWTDQADGDHQLGGNQGAVNTTWDGLMALGRTDLQIQSNDGNLVWRALKQVRWLSDEQRMIYMSYTGTVIVTNNADGVPTPVVYEATIKNPKELLTGAVRTGEQPTNTLDQLRILRCNDYTNTGTSPSDAIDANTGCRGVSETTLQTLPPEAGQKTLAAIARDRMIEIVTNIRNGNPQPQPVLDFIANSRLPVYRIASVASAMNGAQDYMIAQYADAIGIDYATAYTDKVLDTVLEAINKLEMYGTGSVRQALQDLRTKLRAKRMELYELRKESMLAINNITNVAQTVSEAEKSMMQGMPATLSANVAYTRSLSDK